jgi:hypothetical protein
MFALCPRLRSKGYSGSCGGSNRVLILISPTLSKPGPTGGLLRDLGNHLVDQVLWLLGRG